jgi:hypothetical protein
MSGESEDNLERELASLTRWEGGDVQAWRTALAAEKSPRKFGLSRDRTRRWYQTLPRWTWTGIAAAALFLVIVPILHSLGSSIGEERVVLAHAAPEELARKAVVDRAPASPVFQYSRASKGGYGRAGAGTFAESLGYAGGRGGETPQVGADLLGAVSPPANGGYFSPSSGDAADAARNGGSEQKEPASSSVPSSDRTDRTADRHVIRKATIELRVSDVRAAFLKAAHLVSEAHGEYVQDSSLTGNDQRLEGNLTLRVAAERLSAALQALRELGIVRAETAGGEDVTTQVVDLEARLSNEKRVETELLQLMEKRTDAPLKEVLELRAAIGSVRQTIETLTAQRERLGRLVSLATILVIIRPADAPAEPPPPGLWSYFMTAVSRAAERGVQALINTVAGLILVLIGGAFWIVLLAAAAAIVARRLRARRPAS